MRIRIYPYSSRSVSARSVARGLEGMCLKREGSRYQYQTGDVIINWGCSRVPSRLPVTFNKPQAVSIAVSKIGTYQHLHQHGIPTVDWTYSAEEAAAWLSSGCVVYHRATDHGARGAGVTVLKPTDPVPYAFPSGGFFTKRINARREFRLYMVNGEVSTLLEKRRRTGSEGNPYVRSHGNGYVFCRGLRESVDMGAFSDTGARALQALGLDFGGLDVLLKEDGSIYVLEINSAPGITGTALTEFCQKIKERIYA